MVIKGGARGSPAELADHLEKDENERIWIVRTPGVAAQDIRGALMELDALGAGLRTQRTLYHLIINPEPGKEREMSAADWDFAEKAALKKLGLENQPYLTVQHWKRDDDGIMREHRHVIPSRADLDHNRAIRSDHNYRKHEEVARDLERHFGHRKVQGAHAEREGKERPKRTPSHAEMQQEKRGAVSRDDAKILITGLWRTTDSGVAMQAALNAHGWSLARGDKTTAQGRAYLMVIDPQGGTHELARRVDQVKAAAVHARMADLDPASLPSVAEAKAQQQARAAARDARQGERAGIDLAAELAMQEARAAARGQKDDIRPVFTAAAARAAEPAAPDTGKETHRAGGPEPSGGTQRPEPEDMRPLGKTAGDIRTAWNLTRNAKEDLRRDNDELETALAARGISLAEVSPQEAQESQRIAAFAKEVGNFARVLREGEIVAVDQHGDVHRFDQRTTGDLRPEIEARFAGIDRAALLNVTAAKEAMQEASRAAWIDQRRAEQEKTRPPSAIEGRIIECAEQARISGAIIERDDEGRRIFGAEALAARLDPTGERVSEPDTVFGPEAFAARLQQAGIAVVRVTAADVLALDALRRDEDMARLAAETNREAYRSHQFGEVVPGDLAAVTPGGDVHRLNPDKLGGVAKQLAADLPSVVEARAAFEINREATADLWAESRARNAEDRAASNAAFEGDQTLHHHADAASEKLDEAANAVDAGLDAASGFGSRLAKAVETVLGGFFNFFGGGEPKLTPDQAERRAASAHEQAEVNATAAAAQEKAADQDERIFNQDRQQQQEDFAARYGVPGSGRSRERDDDYDRGRERER